MSSDDKVETRRTRFVLGTPINFEGQALYLGALSFRPRTHPPRPGESKSSPEWVECLAASSDRNVALNAGPGELLKRGKTPGQSRTCTQASKGCELIIIPPLNSPNQEVKECTVELLASMSLLNFDTAEPNDIATALALKATTGRFDPDPAIPAATRDAAAWRVVSDLCESMYLNIKD